MCVCMCVCMCPCVSDVQGADYTSDAHTTFVLYYNLWTLGVARAAIGCTLGVAAEISCLGYKIISTSSTSTLPRWHNGPHPLMNKGHRSELHPHTNMHTQMHISKTCRSMFAGSEITRYTNTQPQPARPTRSMVTGLRLQYIHTYSDSKTRTKHDRCSEIAT